MQFTIYFKNKAAFIAPARLRQEFWRVAITLVLAFILYLLLQILIFYFSKIYLTKDDIFQIGNQGEMSSPKSMIFMLSTFIAWFGAVWISVAVVHRRGLQSLFGYGLVKLLRNFCIAFALLLIVYSILGIFTSSPSPLIKNLDPSEWIKWVPIAIPLILIQISAEEILFRGYIQQQLAIRFNSFWIWMVLPAIIFGLLHYQNFDTQLGNYSFLAIADIIILALFLSDITMRTGNLGAALGIHFANNIGMLFVTMETSMSGLALYRMELPEPGYELMMILLTGLTIKLIGIVLYTGVVWRWFRK